MHCTLHASHAPGGGALHDNLEETTKRKSAYWLDINFLGQSNGPLVWMDRNRKYSCFHYLYTSNIENILTDENKQKQKKVAKAGWMIMTASNCIGLYIFTVRYYCIILASPCKINIWLNQQALQFFLIQLQKIFLRLFIFCDIACEASQDLRNDWQEQQKLPWLPLEVDKL